MSLDAISIDKKKKAALLVAIKEELTSRAARWIVGGLFFVLYTFGVWFVGQSQRYTDLPGRVDAADAKIVILVRQSEDIFDQLKSTKQAIQDNTSSLNELIAYLKGASIIKP